MRGRRSVITIGDESLNDSVARIALDEGSGSPSIGGHAARFKALDLRGKNKHAGEEFAPAVDAQEPSWPSKAEWRASISPRLTPRGRCLRNDRRELILRLPRVDPVAQAAVADAVEKINYQPDRQPDEEPDPGFDGQAEH